MSPRKEPANPFYAALLVAAVAFALTACAYGVMAVTRLQPDSARPQSPPGRALLAWLERHGAALMAGELVCLAIAAAAAIGTDRWGSRRAASAGAGPQRTTPGSGSGSNDANQEDEG